MRSSEKWTCIPIGLGPAPLSVRWRAVSPSPRRQCLLPLSLRSHGLNDVWHRSWCVLLLAKGWQFDGILFALYHRPSTPPLSGMITRCTCRRNNTSFRTFAMATYSACDVAAAKTSWDRDKYLMAAPPNTIPPPGTGFPLSVHVARSASTYIRLYHYVFHVFSTVLHTQNLCVG